MEIDQNLVRTAVVASAYLSRNTVTPRDIAALVNSIHGALVRAEAPPPAPVKQAPAVAIKKSVTPDYLICLEDGHRAKMLKRYLRTNFGMTPAQYRAKWGLPVDYPMVTPNYKAARSTHAFATGFGKKKGPRSRKT
jgi:predicted transcriptional regulator